MALSTSLVSYWKFDESSGNASDTLGVNTLVNNNTATYSAGKINNGVNLASASSQYMSRADDASLDITANLSISCWVKVAGNPGSGVYYGIVSKGGINTSSSDTVTQYCLWYDNDGAYRTNFLIRRAGGNFSCTYNSQLTPGTWYHLVGTFQESSAIRLYLNGSEVANNTSTPPAAIVNTAQPFVVGCQYSGSAGNYLNGSVDELGVWSKVLSTGEVTSLYNSGNGLSYNFGESAFTPKVILI